MNAAMQKVTLPPTLGKIQGKTPETVNIISEFLLRKLRTEFTSNLLFLPHQ